MSKKMKKDITLGIIITWTISILICTFAFSINTPIRTNSPTPSGIDYIDLPGDSILIDDLNPDFSKECGECGRLVYIDNEICPKCGYDFNLHPRVTPKCPFCEKELIFIQYKKEGKKI